MDTILITGANGEIGHGLIPELSKTKGVNIIALDVNSIDPKLGSYVNDSITGSVTDKEFMSVLFKKYKFTTIFHLAAILSTGAEKNPEKAHEVNVGGTANILSFANEAAAALKQEVKIVFPSTIAVYGFPNTKIKNDSGAIKEDQYLTPITIYGINKLYCEMLGSYYTKNYRLLSNSKQGVDFRALRFPGIISAHTTPTGGTSDYAPEMMHATAKGEGYECFVRPDSIIPFMIMPDAIKALLQLTKVPKNKLTQLVYNVQGFSVTADEIADIINTSFPDSSISYNPDIKRQRIVDSWPASIDDSAARSDWDWKPDYEMKRAFKDYLIPEIQNKYK